MWAEGLARRSLRSAWRDLRDATWVTVQVLITTTPAGPSIGAATKPLRRSSPSIAAVSRFQLLTRLAEDDVGTAIRVEAGRLVDVADAAAQLQIVVGGQATAWARESVLHGEAALGLLPGSVDTAWNLELALICKVGFVRPR